jgi:uncharacterized membrane protein YczE
MKLMLLLLAWLIGGLVVAGLLLFATLWLGVRQAHEKTRRRGFD